MLKISIFILISFTSQVWISTEAKSTNLDDSSQRYKALSCDYEFENENSWGSGENGKVSVTVGEAVDGWTIEISFDGDVDEIDFYTAEFGGLEDGVAIASNMEWNGIIEAGGTLELEFQVHFDYGDDVPSVIGVKFNDAICMGGDVTTSKPTTNEPSTTSKSTTSDVTPSDSSTTEGSTKSTTSKFTTPDFPCDTKYDYQQVIHYSNLFYQAQRSGKLDVFDDFDHEMVGYRGDSCLDDGSDNGDDLVGGYFDAGDYVKFNFPMASTATVLAWGAIDFNEGYSSVGQLEATLNSVKWVTDYLIKCHSSENELYGQVGDGNADHAQWTRVEEMTIPRPSFKLDTNKPGSDLAGESSAALAAASIAFSEVDPAYSKELLEHSKQLFDFADQYRGKYSDSIPEAANFYNSWSGYMDELLWSAGWLYKATEDSFYLDKADEFFEDSNAIQFSWDDKTIGAQVLLAQLTGEDRYVSKAAAFCDELADSHQKTPQGMVWIDSWGALRHASNVAFICLEAAKIEDSSIDKEKYRQFALNQIHYALGDTGRSYVVGYGENPPQRPHHRSSSCPVDPNETCDWSAKENPGPNPSTLWGALVGGPGLQDDYNDDRNDFVHNEVACDYNAGFQSALAGLQTLAVQGILPGC